MRPTGPAHIHFDTIVHGQDIAIPLGRTLCVTPKATAAGADRAVEVGWPVWNRHRLDGVRLIAGDIGWTFGRGSEIRGPALALLLLVTGRAAGLARPPGRESPSCRPGSKPPPAHRPKSSNHSAEAAPETQ
ncbi:hypothetical protein GFY24_26740 [Nocardia sp. SYP-A9097]|uniref:hypothetical protein n=1 Tax=Nocardia sp. SYP-A9097 TaxID=2663237 RepID=UPI00129B2B1D|nr:hypothetical protein [Nocardia sp. SYP-A9097]MRH90996.1 hypothetical protein [Nocardia sp. SYP-A9097]